MVINLKNGVSGFVKTVPVGFSWTTFWFSGFPALFRGDIKWGIIQILLAMITYGASSIFFAFIYNKMYIKSLLSQGFKPADDMAKTILLQNGIIIAE